MAMGTMADRTVRQDGKDRRRALPTPSSTTAFFFGALLVAGGFANSGSLDRLEQSLGVGERPSNLSQLLLLALDLLSLALWSVIDAVRVARRCQ